MNLLTPSRYLLLLSLPFLLVGCNGSTPMSTTTEQDVYAQIEGLGDATGSDAMFEAAFAPGAAPEDRQAYSQYAYGIAGEATIDGDEATVPVTIYGGVVSSQQGDRAAQNDRPGEMTETERTWKLQRVGEEWKIKEAPLPG